MVEGKVKKNAVEESRRKEMEKGKNKKGGGKISGKESAWEIEDGKVDGERKLEK